MRVRALLLCGLSIAFLFLSSPLSVLAATGTISGDAKYGWGENAGWINFAPDNDDGYVGLTVTDTVVTGYAWSSAYGWINFAPTDSGQGVTNTTGGVLGGQAWAGGLGWLDMSGVTIDANGRFKGTAGVEGSPVGRISFDCDHCDVETAWRPTTPTPPEVVEPTPPAPTGNGTVAPLPPVHILSPVPPTLTVPAGPTPSSDGVQIGPAITQSSATVSANSDPIAAFYKSVALSLPSMRADSFHLESYNHSLIVGPGQEGLLVYDFGAGVGAAVEIPIGASKESVTYSIAAHAAASDPSAMTMLVLGSVVFDIDAVDSSGDAVHAFDTPLKITLTVPVQLEGTPDVGVFWYDPASSSWTAVPDFSIKGNIASFSVEHLSRFAIMRVRSTATTGATPSKTHERELLAGALLLACLFAVLLARRPFKRA